MDTPSGASLPVEPVATYRLSTQQRNLWRHLDSIQSPNVQIVLRVDASIDSSRLFAAMEAVCERNEILRTSFQCVPGMALPVQAVNTACTPSWRSLDLSDQLPDAIESGLLREIEQEREGPFALRIGPVVRCVLIKLGQDCNAIVLTVPALCADLSAMRNIVRELALFYVGPTSQLDSPALQYTEIAQWQDELLVSDDKHASDGRSFWQDKVNDLKDPVSLPFRHMRSSGAFSPAIIQHNIDIWLIRGIDDLATRVGVSASTVCEALWSVLLGRFANISSVVVGHECDGRGSAPELDGALGLLSKTLPIRFQIEPASQLGLLLREADSAIRDAVGWEEYYTSESSEIDDALRYRFSYDDRVDFQIPMGFTISDFYTCAGLFDVMLACRRSHTGMQLELSYDPRRYHRADILSMALHYESLLKSALCSEQSPVGSLNVLPELQRKRAICDWNSTKTDFPPVAAVHQLFEQAVKRTPGATAVVYEDQSLTYSQLNARANQLAHHLIGQNVRPDMPVGLCLERSLDLIVGLLGIMKAGGAYVPIDPSMPLERMVGMLSDCGASLLVSRQGVDCVKEVQIKSVLLDRDAVVIEQESILDPAVPVAGEHLVYVIFTSGSTGRPKGVCIEHRNLLNYVHGVGERLCLPPGAAYATVSTIAADLGNTALFPALCTGGCLHLISQERAMDSSLWQAYFQAHTIDCLKIVPSHLAALLSCTEASSLFLPKRLLILGGEASDWEMIKFIHSLNPSLRILNHYGPTETTVGVLTYEVGTDCDGTNLGTVTVPLGRPLPNSRIYLLNEYLEPSPIGAVGEIYVGGAGVGRGYLNHPELTDKKFICDPFAAEVGSHLYRSGDLARALEDGNIEFLGRADDQVKIRGYRIEPREIESTLVQHPAVRDAVVLAREDIPGEKRLVAYVVFHGEAIGGTEMREHLKQSLPEYMVPGTFITLNRLPLTLNGKVDRKALPAPGDAEERQIYIAPQSDLEVNLAGIWSNLLRRERVSIADNFFDLGGHSLLATQVISRVRESFRVEVPLRALFESPTVAGLAAAIEQARTNMEIGANRELERLLADVEGLSDSEALVMLNAGLES